MADNWNALLKDYRFRHGLSQRQVAAIIGVSQRTISRWERGEDRPHPEKLKLLRDMTLTTPSELLPKFTLAVSHCPAPRALSMHNSLRLIALSEPAIRKRPSIREYVGSSLVALAEGVLQEMLDDRQLQRDIVNKEIACVVTHTRSVLRTLESADIGNYRTTISYFMIDGTLYSDAVSVPASSNVSLGYEAIAVAAL